jgi:cell fate (sporulation/competence/biofilm development) regulator YmcA (YheA/YmcA/DUF963 family)
VRAYAQAEHEQYHRAGVLEFDSVSARAALYERIAARIEDTARPLAEEGLRRLEDLIAEIPPVRDYGPRAQDRNELIAAILADLEES